MLILFLFPVICFAPVISEQQKKAGTDEIITGLFVAETIEKNIGRNLDNNIPYLSPIKVNEIKRISDLYGWRKRHPITQRTRFHHGVDFAVPIGTSIRSTGNGIVISAKRRSGYGKDIIIDHENGYITRYSHLSKINVNKGDTISHMNIIGLSGNSGISTGPHLHYEIVKNGRTIDPMSLYEDISTKRNIKLYLNSLANIEKIAWLYKSNLDV